MRFETAMGEQLQVDWVEFRKGGAPLQAFCATFGFSRASYVGFVGNMKVGTLIACYERAFAAFGGVTRRVLYDDMKTVALERDAYGDGEHRYHAGFLDYARHSGLVIKLCQPYRAKTMGKFERFNGYLRRSFYVPLASRLAQSGQQLDVVTANVEVAHCLRDVANARIHGTIKDAPAAALKREAPHLQALPPPWRANIAAARPQPRAAPVAQPRPAAVLSRSAQPSPSQDPLQVYDALLGRVVEGGTA